MTSRSVDDGAGHGTASTPGAKHRDTAIPPPLQSDFDRLKEEVESWKRSLWEWKTLALKHEDRAEAAEARATQALARVAELERLYGV